MKTDKQKLIAWWSIRLGMALFAAMFFLEPHYKIAFVVGSLGCVLMYIGAAHLKLLG